MTMQIYNPRPALVKSFWCIFFEFFVSPIVDFVHPLLGVRCPQKKDCSTFRSSSLAEYKCNVLLFVGVCVSFQQLVLNVAGNLLIRTELHSVSCTSVGQARQSG